MSAPIPQLGTPTGWNRAIHVSVLEGIIGTALTVALLGLAWINKASIVHALSLVARGRADPYDERMAGSFLRRHPRAAELVAQRLEQNNQHEAARRIDEISAQEGVGRSIEPHRPRRSSSITSNLSRIGSRRSLSEPSGSRGSRNSFSNACEQYDQRHENAAYELHGASQTSNNSNEEGPSALNQRSSKMAKHSSALHRHSERISQELERTSGPGERPEVPPTPFDIEAQQPRQDQGRRRLPALAGQHPPESVQHQAQQSGGRRSVAQAVWGFFFRRGSTVTGN